MKLSAVILASACICSVLSLPTSNEAEQLELLQRAPRVKRVIGGTDVMEGTWPWLVHLTGKIPRGGWWGGYTFYYCGGSIVNKRWVLTAAHCFKAPGASSKIMTAKYWHIKAGEVERKHNIFDNVRSWFGGWFGREDWRLIYEHGEKIITHEAYSDIRGANWKNDIALVKVDTDLPVDDSDPNVATTTLPNSTDLIWPSPLTECVMKGWGCTDKGGPVEDIAKQVVLPAQPSEVCSRQFGDIGPGRMCAGETLAGTGICQGDSGGPLVCKKNDVWVQAGLASFTSASDPGNVPGVFTRVAYYRDWIDRVISENP